MLIAVNPFAKKVAIKLPLKEAGVCVLSDGRLALSSGGLTMGSVSFAVWDVSNVWKT